jgi:hypothetical protein
MTIMFSVINIAVSTFIIRVSTLHFAFFFSVFIHVSSVPGRRQYKHFFPFFCSIDFFVILYLQSYTKRSKGCFKKSFTTLKAYRNLYRGHTQRFELSKCSKTHRVLPRIIFRNCFDIFFWFLLGLWRRGDGGGTVKKESKKEVETVANNYSR